MQMPDGETLVQLLTALNTLVLGVMGFFKHKERKQKKATTISLREAAAGPGPMRVKPVVRRKK